jgi:hypothetical protein
MQKRTPTITAPDIANERTSMSISVTPVTVKTALTRTGGFLYAFTHSLTPYWAMARS